MRTVKQEECTARLIPAPGGGLHCPVCGWTVATKPPKEPRQLKEARERAELARLKQKYERDGQ